MPKTSDNKTILKVNKEKKTDHTQRNKDENLKNSHQKLCKQETTETLQSTERKRKKPVNLKFYGQQQYPLNNEREIASSQKKNKSGEKVSPADLPYKR